MILGPKNFPEGFRFGPIPEIRAEMKVVGVFPNSFWLSQQVLKMVLAKLHQPWVQN